MGRLSRDFSAFSCYHLGGDRGREYAIAEVTNPVRTVTGLVKVEGQRQPLSVKTREPVPKSEIPAVLEALRNTVARRPVVLGQEILPNIVSTTAFP